MARKKGSRLGRLARIGGLGAKVGGSWVGQKIKGALQSADEREEGARKQAIDGAREVVKTMRTMKGAAMKVGQGLAQVAEGLDLPDDVAASLRELNNKAKPVPASVIKAEIERSLEAPLDELFASFSDEPLGTASLAQAHAATLKDGTRVVVKVLHPGIEETIDADLFAMRSMFVTGRLMQRPKEELQYLFAEIEERVREELDYYQEAANIELAATGLAHIDGIRVPRTYPSHCTDRVLTMDHLPGVPLEDWLPTATSEMRHKAGSNLVDAFHHMLFEMRAVHADPHEGNYLFCEDGTVCLLDFGCMKRLSEHWVANYARIGQGAFKLDRELTLSALEDIGSLTERKPASDEVAWQFMLAFCKPFLNGPYEMAGPQDTVHEDIQALMPSVLRHPTIRTPKDMVFIHRTLGGIYSMVRRVNVTMDWGELATPYHLRAIARAEGRG
ncbi:MAG: AarF/ABC1/UbiB kinase family protein [Proteobacteria bacterium]|nr:AarF/ABC1/UbiB kinase family protein [Pseudomonadota bacterium]MCP4921736.1 AarF/ABC1/UbiB kinase family protein [Pseudomonadota bacterium]